MEPDVFSGQLTFNLPSYVQGHTVEVSISIYNSGPNGAILTTAAQTVQVPSATYSYYPAIYCYPDNCYYPGSYGYYPSPPSSPPEHPYHHHPYPPSRGPPHHYSPSPPIHPHHSHHPYH